MHNGDGSRVPSEQIYWHWLREGWKYRARENSRMRKHKQEYAERVPYESDLVVAKDFTDYFIMLSDAVRFAKNRNIGVGPARGSAASSLVCYLLRITEIDPLAFPTMMFERFLDASRIDLPDVDLDFDDDRRDEVRQYMAHRYGAERVGNIGNFVRYRGKNSINDIARVYRIAKSEAETINNLIIERSGGDSRISDSLEDTFEMFPQAAAVRDRHPEFHYATRLEGNYRGMSVHAAGLVISNAPITDTCAVYQREVAGEQKSVVAYDKKDAEYLGMLKADFLGLSTMGMIDKALDMIGMPLVDLYRLPLDDEATLDGFKRNDVTGIFQFEGRATRLVNGDVVPQNFLELADVTSLSRPGPLFSGMTAQYTEIKHGRQEIEHLHPIVDKHTQNTYGQIVYQEQVLSIIKELGGFPVKAVGDIRRIISQKLGEAQFNSMRQDFLDGAWKLHGVDNALADRIWKFMVTSATYSFNISHSVAYAMISYYCMWLKVHHPAAFYAAQLCKTAKEKWPKLLRDAERHGIKASAPDPVLSGKEWHKVDDHSVIAGFEQIPGVAAKTADRILEHRAAAQELRGVTCGDYDWPDLQAVHGIGEKTIAKIVAFCGREDPFLLYENERIMGRFRDDYDGILTHDADGLRVLEGGKQGKRVIWAGMVKHKQYKDLIEDERARSGDDLETIRARVKDPDLVKSCVLHCFDDTEEEVYCRINRWKFPNFRQALEGLHEGDIVVAKGLKRDGFGISIQIDSLAIYDSTEYREGSA